MRKDRRSRYAGMLLGLGVGIALGIALDNIAIGIGVGFVFFAGEAIGLRKDEDQKE